jgi:hypothetical protein
MYGAHGAAAAHAWYVISIKNRAPTDLLTVTYPGGFDIYTNTQP